MVRAALLILSLALGAGAAEAQIATQLNSEAEELKKKNR